jgi:hypothetical protein
MSGEKSEGLVLQADTYVAANPETGDRARIVATVRINDCETDHTSRGPGFVSRFLDADCKLNMAGLSVLSPEMARELRAVRVLDAWSKKHSGSWRVYEDQEPAPDAAVCHAELYNSGGAYIKHSSYAATAVQARIDAADALLKEDPTLGTEV